MIVIFHYRVKSSLRQWCLQKIVPRNYPLQPRMVEKGDKMELPPVIQHLRCAIIDHYYNISSAHASPYFVKQGSLECNIYTNVTTADGSYIDAVEQNG